MHVSLGYTCFSIRLLLQKKEKKSVYHHIICVCFQCISYCLLLLTCICGITFNVQQVLLICAFVQKKWCKF